MMPSGTGWTDQGAASFRRLRVYWATFPAVYMADHDARSGRARLTLCKFLSWLTALHCEAIAYCLIGFPAVLLHASAAGVINQETFNCTSLHAC
jgi:hypothetical protein